MNPAQRLGWISACIRLFGRFGPREKKTLASAFEISQATLSRDQNAFIDAVKDEGLRIEKGKLVADRLGRPAISGQDLDPGLDLMMQVFLDGSYVRLEDIWRTDPPEHVTGAILEAILDRRAVHIEYVEDGGSSLSWLAVSPHAVARVNGGLHARCFDHGRGQYRNFAMNRITLTTFDRSDRPGYVGPERDAGWRSHAEVSIGVRESDDTLAARLDHGIGPDGVRMARVRKALLPLVLAENKAGSLNFREVEEP